METTMTQTSIDLIDRIEVTQVVGFDYSVLPADVQEEARAVADRIKERNRVTWAAILDTGLDLLEIKQQLQHGSFLGWIEHEFGMTERTAQNYMRAASEFGDKSEIVADLPLTTIYTLAAP